MKYFALIFLTTFLFHTHICADNIAGCDSTFMRYETSGNGTVFYRNTIESDITNCGLVQYEKDTIQNIPTTDEYGIDNKELLYRFNNDENYKKFFLHILEKVLECYGKERCSEMLEINRGQQPKLFIRICIGSEGYVKSLTFSYFKQFEKFMTEDDIIRITDNVIANTPFAYFAEYAELGVKILPPVSIPILMNYVEH